MEVERVRQSEGKEKTAVEIQFQVVHYSWFRRQSSCIKCIPHYNIGCLVGRERQVRQLLFLCCKEWGRMVSGSVQISLDLLVGMEDTSKKRLAGDVLPEFSFEYIHQTLNYRWMRIYLRLVTLNLTLRHWSLFTLSPLRIRPNRRAIILLEPSEYFYWHISFVIV